MNQKSLSGLTLIAVALCAVFTAGCGRMAEANHKFDPPAGSSSARKFELGGAGNGKSINGATVTPAFFGATRVSPLLGRIFLAEEYNGGGRQVAVISNEFWRSQFGANPSVIGSSLELNRKLFTVIGVMPSGVDSPAGCQVWIPAAGQSL